jgi:hypothetical protein
MLLTDFTTIVALDEKHFYEFFWSFSTWEKMKPEIVNAPMIIIYDSDQLDFDNYKTMAEKHVKFIDHLKSKKNITFVPFKVTSNIYANQREKMLTSFFVATKLVKTKWFLKIDVDALASNNDKGWLHKELFDGDPVCCSSPWGYTKPPDTFDVLDAWGNTQVPLRNFPELKLPYEKGSDLVKSNRIISFVYFGLTEWTNQMASMCFKDGAFKLPVPSQDTFMWYCAERRKENYKRIKYKKFGFEHWNSFSTIKSRSLEICGEPK